MKRRFETTQWERHCVFAYKSVCFEDAFHDWSDCISGRDNWKISGAFKNFAFVINGARQVKAFSIDFHKDFIQVPLPVRVVPCPILTDFSRELWPKTFNPKPNCFVTDIDATFMQDVFHLTKTQWITYVIHHCQSDDFRWSLEIFKGRTCCHLPKIGINRKTVKFVWQCHL